MKSFINGLKTLPFENSAYKLPIDTTRNNQVRRVVGYCYSEVFPEPKLNPKLIAHSDQVFSLIGVQFNPNSEEDTQILAGNLLPDLAKPIAHCYCGYQFGNWAGQLGDGRAISLGDVNGQELQLKGSGLTPYSRFADGLAVMRSSIREFLCSEAMNALHIPTTRAASLVETDTLATRDMFYDGKPKKEKCAVLMRVAPTFIRFGSFEIEKDLNERGSLVPKLWDYCQKYFESKEYLKEIILKTARLVALWQSYGFCHGVLNTDNMSIIGVTIDYGPFAFMEYFNRRHICNHSDDQGRYSYENQPGICKWNLIKLCEALDCVIDQKESKELVENLYSKEYENYYFSIMLKKLGLKEIDSNIAECNQIQRMVVEQFFKVLNECSTNYSQVYNVLIQIEMVDDYEEYSFSESDLHIIDQLCALSAPRELFLKLKQPMITEKQLEKIKEMPIQHQYMMGYTEQFIQEQDKQLQEYNQLAKLSEDELKALIKMLWKDWISFYKSQAQLVNRRQIMQQMNPIYTLTNSVLQQVIEDTNSGNYELLHKVQKAIENPFENHEGMDQIFNKICDSIICVSCSS